MAEKKYIEGFPQTQAERKEWLKKYKFDPAAKTSEYPTGRWYEAVAGLPPGEPEVSKSELGEVKKALTALGEREKAGVGEGVGVGVGAGEEEEGNGETSYQQVVLNAIAKYLEDISGQKSWKEIYAAESERLGIPGMREKVTGITEQVLDVEELLDKLESDVESRTEGLLVTGAQRRRQLATEGAPLREQLADLVRAETRAGAGLAGARGQLATLMGLEEKEREAGKLGLEMLPLYKEAMTYETPEEKSARELKEKQAEMEAGLRQDYREVTPVKPNVYRVTDDEGNVTQITFDPYTMEETGRVNLGKIGKGKEGEEITEAEQLKAAKADMKAQLMLVRGADGYISPESYKTAKEAWHQAGLSRRKFDEYFELFVNPSHPEDYGLEGV